LPNPLCANSANYTNRFLDYLLAGGTSGPERVTLANTEVILRDDLSRFSLLNQINDLPHSLDDYNTYVAKLFTLTPVRQVILQKAVYDGLDLREATRFIDEWTCFLCSWGDIVSYVPGSLDPQHMMFWAALRRGWAHWRPTKEYMEEVRVHLLNESQIRHQFRINDDQPSSRRELSQLVLSSNLPLDELNRLDPSFYPSNPPLNRMISLFSNWIAIAEHVEQGRLQSEADFTEQQLRMDRLERLIREERLVNEGIEIFDDNSNIEDNEPFADADEGGVITFVRHPDSTQWA
jgi:hypothetical protein